MLGAAKANPRDKMLASWHQAMEPWQAGGEDMMAGMQIRVTTSVASSVLTRETITVNAAR